MNEQNLKPQKSGEPSHNPLGRKKGTKNYKTILKKYLNLKLSQKDLDVDIPYLKNDTKKYTTEELIILRCIKKAINTGDYKTAEWLMNRRYGLQEQKTKHSGGLKIEGFNNLNETEIDEKINEKLRLLNDNEPKTDKD